MTDTAERDRLWLETWIEQVRSGNAGMSRRARSAIDRRGGIDAAIDAARRGGVHLVELTDDEGRTLIAASRAPFRTLC